MATIKRALSAKTNPSGRAEIMLRVSVSHSVSHRIKSGLFIKKELFKDNKFSNPRDPELKKEVRDVQDRLDEIEKFLIRICEDTPLNKVTKDFLLTQLDLFLNPPRRGYTYCSRSHLLRHLRGLHHKEEYLGMENQASARSQTCVDAI